MRKAAVLKIFVVLALALGAAFGAQLFGIARANPFFNIPIVDPVPGTTPPSIEIVSPQNSTTYPSSDIVPLSFNVTKPALTTAYRTNVTWVYYILDNQPFMNRTTVNSIYASTDDVIYTANLTLPKGDHTLTIYAEGVVWVAGGIFEVNSTSSVFFTAAYSSSSPPTSENNPLNSTIGLLVVGVVVVVVISAVAGVLVWRRTHR
jgi:hypothetical protein